MGGSRRCCVIFSLAFTFGFVLRHFRLSRRPVGVFGFSPSISMVDGSILRGQVTWLGNLGIQWIFLFVPSPVFPICQFFRHCKESIRISVWILTREVWAFSFSGIYCVDIDRRSPLTGISCLEIDRNSSGTHCHSLHRNRLNKFRYSLSVSFPA